MENIGIRKAGVKDVAALQQISRQTFTETYSATNTSENITKYLEEDFSLNRLTKELHNTSSGFYFVMDSDKIIGYLKLNTGDAQTELKDQNTLEIERIYVLQAYQGKQIGQLLYNKAIAIGAELNADFVWLGVWEKNLKAIRFYEKNGFVNFDTHTFLLGEEVQNDFMMKKALK